MKISTNQQINKQVLVGQKLFYGLVAAIMENCRTSFNGQTWSSIVKTLNLDLNSQFW